MRFVRTLIAALGLAATSASAQPVSFPCTLICFPPAHLDAKKCACEETQPRRPACSLVCLDPNETLDARKCACVRRSR